MRGEAGIDPCEAVARLRRVAACVRRGEPISPEDAGWFLDGTFAYLADADAGVRLDDALGLTSVRGALPWWRAERLEARDAALREAAACYAPTTPSAAARAILREWRRYRRSAWAQDCEAVTIPPQLCGTVRGHLWRAAKSAPIPETRKRIRDVLEAEI